MITLWLAAGLASAGVVVDPPPSIGAPSLITITDEAGQPRAGLSLRAVHRPGLWGAREVGAGITDARGRTRWTPEQAGATALFSGNEALGVVRVGWDAPPTSVWLPIGLLTTLTVGVALAGRKRRP